jgi:hypothetical protein
MATEGFLNNTQLDFVTYKASLKQYLSQQTQFQDYDFEGSNLSVLLDLLAYNTYHNAMYLNMIGSEMFLDTAQLRESVVSHAKELNYIPRSRSSSSVEVTFIASPTDDPNTIVLPAYYSISGNNTTNNYTFSTNNAIILSKANNYIANITFYEGTVRTEAFIVGANNANSVFELSSNTIDSSSIQVQVRNSSSDLTTTTWNKMNDIYGLTANSEVFFVQAASEFKYAITFGNDVIGKKLIPGNIVLVSYRETSGEEGNSISNFRVNIPAYGYSANTFTITNTEPSSGGAYAESLDSIRFNAIRSFSTQNRAVTTSDFVTLLKSQFPAIQTIIAYGGEQSTPKRYGKVIISAKPNGAEVFSTAAKQEILSFLSDKTTISIDPVFVDPEYLYLDVSTRVKYDVNSTTLSPDEIRVLVSNSISTFSNTNLSTFSSDLRVSKLIGAIDNSNAAVVSNDTKIKIIKRIIPDFTVPFNANWSFENELYSENVKYILPLGHEPIISSTPFQYNGKTSYIQDNGVGNLYVYTIANGTSTTVLQTSVGSVNYTTGEIIISGLIVDSYEDDYIKIYAKLENSDVDILTNKILLIDEEDVNIDVIGIRV